MASLAVMNIVNALVATAWGSNTPIVAADTTGIVPSDNSAFLMVTFPVATEIQKSVGAPGANFYREEGAFRCVLYAPVGRGLNPSATPYASWIDALRAALRGQIVSGLVIFEASPPTVNNDSDKGAYWEMSFATTYHFDVQG